MIVVGDRVRVVKPDQSGTSAILASYDAAYLVQAVRGDNLQIETRVAGMPDPVLVYEHEVEKVDERPWWEKG